MRRQALSRSYGRFFAEFLKGLSLVRLGLLDLITCVGLRYGTVVYNVEDFLGSALTTLTYPKAHLQATLGSDIKVRSADLPTPHPHATSDNPISRSNYSTPSLHRNTTVSWNINHVSIASPIRDRLRPD